MVALSGKAAFVLVLVSGIVIPGVMNYVLSVALGQEMLGRMVWVLGYTMMIGVIWYGWLRPLDLQGPELDSNEAERKVKD
jgi:membrane protein CcdC involved in cytochrome C biogenesis